MHSATFAAFQDELIKIAYSADELRQMGSSREGLGLKGQQLENYVQSHLSSYGGSYRPQMKAAVKSNKDLYTHAIGSGADHATAMDYVKSQGKAPLNVQRTLAAPPHAVEGTLAGVTPKHLPGTLGRAKAPVAPGIAGRAAQAVEHAPVGGWSIRHLGARIKSPVRSLIRGVGRAV